MNLSQISQLIEIAERAIEFSARQSVVKHRKAGLNRAYRVWKSSVGIEHVGRDTPDWDQMMVATSAEYALYQGAKNAERNARRRLETSIKRHKNCEGAQ